MNKFEWIENPEKEIAESTRASYQARLNNLYKKVGVRTRNDILNQAPAVREYIDLTASKQMRNLYYASVFYILGRIDPVADPRGATLIEGFQRNYHSK